MLKKLQGTEKHFLVHDSFPFGFWQLDKECRFSCSEYPGMTTGSWIEQSTELGMTFVNKPAEQFGVM